MIWMGLGHFFEIFFGNTAQGTGPIVGDVFKSGSGLNTAIRVSNGRVINPITYGASVLFHNSKFY